jgi:hypothetical protein
MPSFEEAAAEAECVAASIPPAIEVMNSLRSMLILYSTQQ